MTMMPMTVGFPSSVRTTTHRRGKGVVAAAHERRDDVVASGPSSSSQKNKAGAVVTRRAVLLGSLALTQARPATAATEVAAKKVSGADAFITLMDGRDAVSDDEISNFTITQKLECPFFRRPLFT
jgi:hypothetical protein